MEKTLKKIAELKAELVAIAAARGVVVAGGNYQLKSATAFFKNATAGGVVFSGDALGTLVKVDYLIAVLEAVDAAIAAGEIDDAVAGLLVVVEALPDLRTAGKAAAGRERAGRGKAGKTKARDAAGVREFIAAELAAGRQYAKEIIPETARRYKIPAAVLRRKFPKKSFFE